MRRGGAPASPLCGLPQVPHRLLTLTLLPGLELCLLCGPRPLLSQLDAQVNLGYVPFFPYFTRYPRPFSEHPDPRVRSLRLTRPWSRPRPS